MKNLILILILAISTPLTYSQEIAGAWYGAIEVQGIKLRFVFHITEADEAYSATMDSPDQGASGIPISSTEFDGTTLLLQIPEGQIEYEGSYSNDTIKGLFKQGAQQFPLELTQNKMEKEEPKRPQEPKEPYPYYSEEVSFYNSEADVTLAGTLTLPSADSKVPVVVLISGSGPQNRNEELLGHKPFLVISDHLTRNGIGVLRYDDRGIAGSTGNFATATTMDFASDAESAVAYLKTRSDVDTERIGLMGHSEGGVIAPIVASRSKDVNFIVLLAGTGIRGDKLLLLQIELISRANGLSEEEIQIENEVNAGMFEILINNEDKASLNEELTDFLKELAALNPEPETPEGMTVDEAIAEKVQAVMETWMAYFIKHDPAPVLEKVSCPVLAVNGDKDLQVPSQENLTAIKEALNRGGNENVTTIEFKNLNHLFQECTTGAPSEYAGIEQTFSPAVLEAVTRWILQHAER